MYVVVPQAHAAQRGLWLRGTGSAICKCGSHDMAASTRTNPQSVRRDPFATRQPVLTTEDRDDHYEYHQEEHDQSSKHRYDDDLSVELVVSLYSKITEVVCIIAQLCLMQ